MEGSRPRPELPAEFAVFPLPGAVLFPHGRLPLNIFEPRYLALVDDSLAAGRVFGMIQPDPALGEGASGPGLYRVGCLGRLTSFAETDDGRYLITLSGLCRFAVLEEIGMRRGYRRVRASFTAFAGDLDLQQGSMPGANLGREALLVALRAYFAAEGLEANWDAIGQMQDAALVVTLCMVCPFEPAEKQALLEIADPKAQAEALLALLSLGAHSSNDTPTQPS
jgi:Lon protease-like protein